MTTWFNSLRGKKTQKSQENGIKIKDEEAIAVKNSKSVNLVKASASQPPPIENGVPVMKSKSADDVDPDLYGLNSLEEALQLLADDSQPVVARSTPKGAPIDTSSFNGKEMKHCLFDKAVYEQMLKDSLNTCELLQHNLDDYIVEVRKSPARELGNMKNMNGMCETAAGVESAVKTCE